MLSRGDALPRVAHAATQSDLRAYRRRTDRRALEAAVAILRKPRRPTLPAEPLAYLLARRKYVDWARTRQAGPARSAGKPTPGAGPVVAAADPVDPAMLERARKRYRSIIKQWPPPSELK